MSSLRWILTLISISLVSIVYYGMSSQNVAGDGNVQNQGNNNTIDNHTQISKIQAPEFHARTGNVTINNYAVKEGLESGRYKDVILEDKKPERSPRKRVLIITGTNNETAVFHEIAHSLNIPVKKDIIQDHVVYSLGTFGDVDVFHIQPGVMGTLESWSTPMV